MRLLWTRSTIGERETVTDSATTASGVPSPGGLRVCELVFSATASFEWGIRKIKRAGINGSLIGRRAYGVIQVLVTDFVEFGKKKGKGKVWTTCVRLQETCL